MYKALEGFIEVFEPLLQILGSLSLQWASEDLKVSVVFLFFKREIKCFLV